MDKETRKNLLFKLKKISTEAYYRSWEIKKMLDPKLNFRFIKIAENEAFSELPEEVIEATQRMLEYCQLKLKLPGLFLEWVREAELYENYETYDCPFYAIAKMQDEKILVNVDASFDKREAEMSIAHEAHHIWYAKKYGWPSDKQR